MIFSSSIPNPSFFSGPTVSYLSSCHLRKCYIGTHSILFLSILCDPCPGPWREDREIPHRTPSQGPETLYSTTSPGSPKTVQDPTPGVLKSSSLSLLVATGCTSSSDSEPTLTLTQGGTSFGVGLISPVYKDVPYGFKENEDLPLPFFIWLKSLF